MNKPSRKNFKGFAHADAKGPEIGSIYLEGGSYVIYGLKDTGGFSGEKSAPLSADKFTFMHRFDNGFQIEKHYLVAA